MTQKQNDELDSIIDSMSDDEEIEKKIDAFAENKKRNKRVQRAREVSAQFTQTYGSRPKEEESRTEEPSVPERKPQDQGMDIPSFMQESQHEPVILGSQDFQASPSFHSSVSSAAGTPGTEANQQDQVGMTRRVDLGGVSAEESPSGNTRVFSADEVGQSEEPVSHTVTMGSDEISSLLEQDEQKNAPLLRREYVEDEDEYEPEEEVRPVRPRKSSGSSSFNWKIAAAIGGTLLAVLVIFGGYSLVRSWFDQRDKQQEEAGNQAEFEQILNWANGYGNLDEEGQKSIKDYKSIYNRLNADQKKQINDVLEGIAGKTFNQLLAAANAPEKPDSKNENTANAEKKAELKRQIQALQSEIDGLKNDLANAQNSISQAKDDYNQKVGVQTARQTDYNDAQAKLDALNSELTGLQVDQASIDNQIQALQSQLDSLPEEEKESDGALELERQIESLKEERRENISRQGQIPAEIKSATTARNNAKDAYDEAVRAADAAQQAYDKVAGSDASIQNSINEKQAQKDDLQRQYDAID